MERINKYKIYSSKIEKLHDKVVHTNELADYDISVVKEKANKKIAKFIKRENDELYRVEFVTLDLESEVNYRLPKAMLAFNKKDYWKRRAAIQKMRLANYSKEACDAYEEEIKKLDELKAQKEALIKAKMVKKFTPYILKDENQICEVKAYIEKQKKIIEEKIATYTEMVRKNEKESIDKIISKKEAKVKSLKSKIERYKSLIDKDSDKAYKLDENIVLKVENLTMQFGGLKAVDNLSFEVKEGEIFGLIGPNGAGKTTVFNCITQFYKPTKGTLLFKEKAGNVIKLTDYVVHNVIKKGIVRTFQNVEVVKEITVLENLLVAAHSQYHSSLFTQFLHLPFLKKEEKAIKAKAEEVLEFMGLSLYKNFLAWGLPYGILKKIEIARTLMNNPQLIILDEPAAGLNDSETAELTKLIRKIQEKYKCTILLVEHDMGLVMDICDTVCAISFGKLLAIGNTEEIQANKDVQAAYLGYSEEE